MIWIKEVELSQKCKIKGEVFYATPFIKLCKQIDKKAIISIHDVSGCLLAWAGVQCQISTGGDDLDVCFDWIGFGWHYCAAIILAQGQGYGLTSSNHYHLWDQLFRQYLMNAEFIFFDEFFPQYQIHTP